MSVLATNKGKNETNTVYKCQDKREIKVYIMGHMLSGPKVKLIGVLWQITTPSSPNYKSPLTFFGDVKVTKYVIKL